MKNNDNDNVEILLVEGDLTKRNELALRLRSKGHFIDMAKNGFHSIKEIEENNYKLMIISDNMKDMGIEEIVTIIRSMENKKKTPIILYDPPTNSIDIDLLVNELSVNHIILSRDFNQLITKVSTYVKK
ncbi:MAG: hypothetical protein KAG61_03405 [Bacteriovoracaceae bacterium]|nr:hypothetical protein [Bacteriovoracaceae bacterium]